jgi:hypothetical protein
VTAVSNNTGRSPRQTQIAFKAANVPDVVRTVIQAGKPEFVTIQSAAAVSKDGVTVLTIEGVSNSSKLTFALASGGSLPLTIPATYLANSLQTNNGAAIAGDPGAGQEFPFSIQFASIAKNPVVTERTAQLIVTDAAGHSATCTITQAAGDATLEVSPQTVNLDWDAATQGKTASFNVTSNTNWTVE